MLSLFFYRLIKKISSFNHFVIDKIVPNDNLNSSFIDKKVLDFFSPLKQIFFHLLSGNILLIQNIRQNKLKIDIAKKLSTTTLSIKSRGLLVALRQHFVNPKYSPEQTQNRYCEKKIIIFLKKNFYLLFLNSSIFCFLNIIITSILK